MEKKLFVTGSSGVLGEPIVSQFEGKELITLYHKNKPNYRDVESFSGDISQPQLGLSDAEYEKLAGGIRGIIHSAALTNFIQKKRLHRTNVQGTEEILKLARRANVPIFHISTAFVHPIFGKPEGGNLYVDSKLAAEKLLAESGHPHTILRPSIVIGDSTTGYMPSFQGFHETMISLMNEEIPVVPGLKGGYVDIIPRDVVGQLIGGIVKKNVVGEEFWLSTGPNATTLDEFLVAILSVTQELSGKKLRTPRLLNPTLYSRVVKPLIIKFAPRAFVQDIRRMEQLEGYYGTMKRLPSSIADLKEKWGITAEYSHEKMLRNNMEWTYNTHVKPNHMDDVDETAVKN